ncbi:hypothetical protein [Porphyromonas gingivalis]|nr:hypothetical protein [Porphyromonas gingivalis]
MFYSKIFGGCYDSFDFSIFVTFASPMKLSVGSWMSLPREPIA